MAELVWHEGLRKTNTLEQNTVKNNHLSVSVASEHLQYGILRLTSEKFHGEEVIVNMTL